MDLHVFPILNLPLTSLPIPSLWVFPVHQPWALVSCIQPGLAMCFTLDNCFKKHYTKHLALLFCMWTYPHLQLYISYFCEVNWNEVKVSQSCLTPCDPMDCSLPGSSVLGILQGRILKWVAVPFYRGSSQPRYRIHIAGGFFTIWATREAPLISILIINRSYP